MQNSGTTRGCVADIKRFAVHDGPGIRTTLFLKGCSLACSWCHNPETISPSPEIGFLRGRCTGCGRCVTACPEGAHVVRDGAHVFERAACVACGRCVAACFYGALEYYGREMSVSEAAAAVLEDRTFYAMSGGGCTLSGGEPLLQADFCAALCARLGQTGIHRAVDTAGAVPWAAFEAVLPHTDLFLYDVKHLDDQAHRAHTGASNALIIENLQRLSRQGVPIEVRIPLVPGFNDSNDALQAFGSCLAGLPNLTRVRLLPFHALARSKYAAIGRSDTMPATQPPDAAAWAAAADVLRRCGLDVRGPAPRPGGSVV
ncbi:MAG: glycyl-radical enzyme activating protein [Lentisphaeria bacterium]|nr:glycyl-radical enzyme activating protein [Lentisphaeria bacterium]